MLQCLCKEKVQIYLLGFLAFMLNMGCKVDTSSQAEEEAAYQADFEDSGNQWGFIDTSGKLVIPAQFDDVSPFSEGMAAVRIKSNWGYIDAEGKIKIPIQYKSAWSFHEGKARVESFGLPETYIDNSGTIKFSGEWSAADDFMEGLARVKVGSLYGYIDSSGHLVIPPIYTRGWNSSGGLIIIDFEDQLGIINHLGQYIIAPGFDHIKVLKEEERILCHRNDSAFMYDMHGKEMVRLDNARIQDGERNTLSVRQDGQMYFFDLVENAIRQGISYSNIIYLEDGKWAGKNENGYQLLDASGKPINNNTYNQINQFRDGIAVYSRASNWGYVDRYGKELTGDIFGLAWDFKEGFARAAFKDGIAFINRELNLAFYPPPGTMDMRDFSEGLAAVQLTRN